MNEHQRWFWRMDWDRRSEIIGLELLNRRFEICNPMLMAAIDFDNAMLIHRLVEKYKL